MRRSVAAAGEPPALERWVAGKACHQRGASAWELMAVSLHLHTDGKVRDLHFDSRFLENVFFAVAAGIPTSQ